MVVCVVTAWGVKLPLGVYLALPVGMGAAGAWLGLTAEIIVISVLAVWRIKGSRWLPVAKPRGPGIAWLSAP